MCYHSNIIPLNAVPLDIHTTNLYMCINTNIKIIHAYVGFTHRGKHNYTWHMPVDVHPQAEYLAKDVLPALYGLFLFMVGLVGRFLTAGVVFVGVALLFIVCWYT